MRKAVVAGFTFLLLIGSGLAQAQKAGDAGEFPEFKALIQRYWKAWNTLNPDNAAPMYAKDADAVFFGVTPLKYNGWEEYKQGVRKVFASAAKAIFTNDDLKVARRGNMVWTSGTFHGAVTQKDGQPMNFDGRHTAIWEKRGGHWIIVHEHVSAPLPG